MGKRTSYEPGTFCWTELGTTDTDAARASYGDLLGWDFQDVRISEEFVLGIGRIDGDSVAAVHPQPERQREAGVPPAWFSYVTVASADDAAAAATEAGGSVHAGPFDAPDSSRRMAVIADPTGAMFGIWEPRESIGATLVNEPGCLTWNELATNDMAKATEFYGRLFGWESEPIDTGGGPPYWVIQHTGAAEGRNGGIRELAPEQAEAGIPPHWMPYFVAESVDEAIGSVTDGGGSAMFGPLDLPTDARIAVVSDPQGAIFGLFEGETDD